MRISDWSSDVCSSDLGTASLDLMEEVSRPQPRRFQRTSNKERTRNGNDAKSSDTRRGQLPLRRNSVGDHSGTTAYNGLPLRWLSKNDGQCVFLKRSHSDAGISRDERRASNWRIARDGATLFLSLLLELVVYETRRN